jgi:hypothetical protein
VTNFVNLTPHAIVLRDPQTGAWHVLPPAGTVARVALEFEDSGHVSTPVQNFPCRCVRPGAAQGLPPNDPEDPFTVYVVSAQVGQAVGPLREDVWCPDTDRAERDEQGRILSVPGLVRYW